MTLRTMQHKTSGAIAEVQSLGESGVVAASFGNGPWQTYLASDFAPLALPSPALTRRTILGDLPVDETTIDRLDKTITDLRERMNGMRDEAEAQDATENRLHRELSAARAAVREADERVRTANLCIKYAKSHISGIASADALRGLRKRLQKSLKNV